MPKYSDIENIIIPSHKLTYLNISRGLLDTHFSQQINILL